MSEYAIQATDQQLLEDAVIHDFVTTTVEIIKLECLQAVQASADGDEFGRRVAEIRDREPRNVAEVVMAHYRSFSADSRSLLVANLEAEATTELTAKYGVDLSSHRPVLEQIDVRQAYSFVMRETVQPKTEPVRLVQNPAPVPQAGRLQSNVRAAQFRIHSVTAVKDTNQPKAEDKIAWGGATTDDAKKVTAIEEHFIGNFRTGHVETFEPEIFATFTVGTNWVEQPTHIFSVTVTLAEKDNGGFSDFLAKLYKAIEKDVQAIMTKLGAAAGAIIGAKIGGALGTTLAGPIGSIIGITLGLIVGGVAGWLINRMKDDLFVPHTSVLVLTRPDWGFPGDSVVSNLQRFRLLMAEGTTGEYAIEYDWVLLT